MLTSQEIKDIILKELAAILDEDSGIYVAEYLTELPPRELLREKLHAARLWYITAR